MFVEVILHSSRWQPDAIFCSFQALALYASFVDRWQLPLCETPLVLQAANQYHKIQENATEVQSHLCHLKVLILGLVNMCHIALLVL